MLAKKSIGYAADNLFFNKHRGSARCPAAGDRLGTGLGTYKVFAQICTSVVPGTVYLFVDKLGGSLLGLIVFGVGGDWRIVRCHIY